jgi:ribosome-binding protein aMBF1 (putative translation factor)
MVPKLTQVELGRKAGVIESIVKDFERGTAAPDQTNIRKLERALEIHLQGSNIGTPKPLFRGPKK